ncbi:MAG: DUF1684 domain-containing protein [Ferruginibacter sp.]
MKLYFTGFLLFLSTIFVAEAQKTYVSSIQSFQKAYVKTHEVVQKKDKKYFKFFEPDAGFKVAANFIRITDSIGFIMKTSGKTPKKYFRYGVASFKIRDSSFKLTIYQGAELMQTTLYKNYLFVPFTDLTSGEESYGAGRYLDLEIDDIINHQMVLDFNKAYNPYCAYSDEYNCPIPPRENYLTIAITAGEKNFAKKIH